ncbi:hypothetical protein GUJ93_ZPchr0009g1298 [Zizania palustris]|uniref:Uncharacterized protein n=1 Tax=Zizania palustris TaxID=103762 RepID=A0A8J5UZC3_ZIZPA|nr:hypothetical protein GUJ93_ZPchr0009g1298 [Zizania palustris]
MAGRPKASGGGWPLVLLLLVFMVLVMSAMSRHEAMPIMASARRPLVQGDTDVSTADQHGDNRHEPCEVPPPGGRTPCPPARSFADDIL